MSKVQQKFFKTAGGINNDSGSSLSANCQNVFVTGTLGTGGVSDFNGVSHSVKGTQDIFVAGLHHDGKQKFFKNTGRPGAESSVNKITSNCDRAFLTGGIGGPTALDFNNCVIPVNGNTGALFVAGVDNCGHQKFFKTAGNGSGKDIVADDNGCVFLTGSLKGTGTKDFNGCFHALNQTGSLPNFGDIVVAGLDECGKQKFFVTAGGIANDDGSAISVNECRVFVTGFMGKATNSIPFLDFKKNPIIPYGTQDIFVAGLDKCGNQIFFKHAGVNSVSSILSSGSSITSNCRDVFVSGVLNNSSNTNIAINFAGEPVPQRYSIADIFVAGLDKCGNQKFFLTAGASLVNFGFSITDNEHGVFATGYVGGPTATDFGGNVVNLKGGADIFVAGLTRCGKQKFFVTAGSISFDIGLSIVANDQGLFVTGTIGGTTGTDFNGDPINHLIGVGDVFVAKLDYCGHQQFFITAGGTGEAIGIQIAIRDNEIFVTGDISNTYDFKHKPITTLKGKSDIFVARLDDLCGKYRSTRSNMSNFPR